MVKANAKRNPKNSGRPNCIKTFSCRRIDFATSKKINFSCSEKIYVKKFRMRNSFEGEAKSTQKIPPRMFSIPYEKLFLRTQNFAIYGSFLGSFGLLSLEDWCLGLHWEIRRRFWNWSLGTSDNFEESIELGQLWFVKVDKLLNFKRRRGVLWGLNYFSLILNPVVVENCWSWEHHHYLLLALLEIVEKLLIHWHKNNSKIFILLASQNKQISIDLHFIPH